MPGDHHIQHKIDYGENGKHIADIKAGNKAVNPGEHQKPEAALIHKAFNAETDNGQDHNAVKPHGIHGLNNGISAKSIADAEQNGGKLGAFS